MRKGITALIILLVLSILPEKAAADFQGELIVKGNVEGEAGVTIACQVLDISITSKNHDFLIDEGADVSSWFADLPSGLSGEVLSVNGNQIQVNVCGTPTQEKYEAIIVRVPDGVIVEKDTQISIGEISNLPDEDAWYHIVSLIPEARYDRPAVIEGCAGEELELQYVYIRLLNTYDEFPMWQEPLILQTNGLKAIVKDYDSEEKIMTVEFSGIPQAEDHSLIHMQVGQELITYDEDLVIADREDVRFDIGVCEVPMEEKEEEKEEKSDPPYLLPKTGVE